MLRNSLYFVLDMKFTPKPIEAYAPPLAMLQMPESQRNLMQQQLNGQHEASEELKERLKEMSQSKASAEFVSRQYICLLYTSPHT